MFPNLKSIHRLPLLLASEDSPNARHRRRGLECLKVKTLTLSSINSRSNSRLLPMDEESFLDHKLCGYLCAVLSVNPPPPQPETLGFKTSCEIFGDGSEVGFRSQSGVVLSPVDSIPEPVPNAEVPASKQCRRNGVVAGKRRVRNIGQVHGSISVVHQLHALVTHKCVKIKARVIWVGIGGDGNGEARAVVLVDVYLPMALWSGWQFPRSGAIAGALFKHLRCGAILSALLILDNGGL